MRRYIGPALLFLLAGATFGLVPDVTRYPWAYLLPGLYGLATIWWVIIAARSPPPFLPHVYAVWVPAVLPVSLILWALWASDEGVDDGFAALFVVPWAAFTLLVCAAGALTLRINRQEGTET